MHCAPGCFLLLSDFAQSPEGQAGPKASVPPGWKYLTLELCDDKTLSSASLVIEDVTHQGEVIAVRAGPLFRRPAQPDPGNEIKRQMHGRAGFTLARHRILLG
jgi:hypothetical protein